MGVSIFFSCPYLKREKMETKFLFYIKSPVDKCIVPKKILDAYKADEGDCSVECEDGSFKVPDWFCNLSDFYLDMKKVRQKFGGSGEKIFNLKEFKKAPIKIFFDSFHGISTDKVTLTDVLGILDFCYYDGKIDLESAFETKLVRDLVKQIHEMKDFPRRMLALTCIYLMAIDKNEDRVVRMCSWKFDGNDFKNAITAVLLNDMDDLESPIVKNIKAKFENENSLFGWTKDIFQKVANSFKCDILITIT